jgi:ABC-2 type transport system permease protein
MLRSELRKLVTTRTAIALVIGATAVVALGAFSTSVSGDAAALEKPLHAQEMYLLSSINVGLFAMILGIRSFTDEFRHATMAWTILSVRDRWRIVTSKSAVSALVGAWIALLALVVMVAITAAVASSKGASLGLNSGDMAAAVGLLVAASAWAVIGTAIGALVRHQVAAIVGAVIWVFAVENLAAGFLGEAGKLLPGQAAHSVADAAAASDLLPTTVGVVVLLGYAVILAVIAAIDLTRRELVLAG